jgi:hypothetical protein
LLAPAFAFGLVVTFSSSQADAQTTGRAREDLVAKLTGKRVHLDSRTGQVRPITADEARDLIAAVIRATDRADVETDPDSFLARTDVY